MPGSPDTVLAEVRQVYGNVVYTHKTHEKEAERAVAVDSALRRTNVIVLGIAVLAAVVAPIVSSPVAAWVAAIATFTGLVFGVVQLTLDPASAIAENRVAAKAYLAMRDSYLRLVTDILDGAERPVVERRREDLAARVQLLHELAPQTSQRSFQAARADIKAGNTGFGDAELDALFPNHLRVGR